MKLANRFEFIAAAIVFAPVLTWARGASPYLPLDMSPAIERQIERVLILAGKPVMRRPIAAAVVLDALPLACERDRTLCDEVRRYLQEYMKPYALTSVKPVLSATSGDSEVTQPNSHGEPVDSAWRISASGYYQPFDSLIINAGGIAYDGRAEATGSFLSVGFDWAQLDIGFRDHWLSPHVESSPLISTEAPTMPSITISNYRPLTPLGLGYEVFYAEMSRQDGIVFMDTTTSGKPKLAGIQGTIEPAVGYALGINRITQYGGGARGGSSFSDFIDALTATSNQQGTENVNRVAALTSSMLFPGKVPFAVRIEYAGEDNAYEGRTRLGATSTTLGLDFPILWSSYDLTYEVTEYQRDWYVHPLYPQGLTNEGNVIGHWFGDNRLFGDAIGGLAQTLVVGWRMRSGSYLQATYRYLNHDDRWRGGAAGPDYDDLHTLALNYSTAWRGHGVEAALEGGRDVFGDSFARLSASFDLAPNSGRQPSPSPYDADGNTDSNTEVFVDVGAQYSNVREINLDLGPNDQSGYATDFHMGFGARRAVSRRNDIGVRLELDSINDSDMISLRAIDYRFRFSRRFAFSAFFGAGRFDLKLPAYGYYWGGGLQYMNVVQGWDIGADYRHHEKLTRDKVVPGDPPFTVQLPRRALDVNGVSLYVTRRW